MAENIMEKFTDENGKLITGISRATFIRLSIIISLCSFIIGFGSGITFFTLLVLIVR